MTRPRETQKTVRLAPHQNSREGLCLVPRACIPGMQEDGKFQTSHGCIVRLVSQKLREPVR